MQEEDLEAWRGASICLGLVRMLFGQPDLTCQQLESEVSWGLEASLAITRACISTS